MKGKIILCASLVALLSANSFALEIYKGRIVSHKEWTTGDAKVVYKPANKNTLIKFKQQRMQSQEGASGYVSTYIDQTQGATSTPIYINGSHYFYIINNTSSTQTYNYTLETCAFDSANTAKCAYYFDAVQLEPNGYLEEVNEPQLQVQFDKAGTYQTFASAYVQNYDNSSTQINISSNSNSVAAISDNVKS